MAVEYKNRKILLVDKKITNARDLVHILEDAIRGGYPILIIVEDIEQESLATLAALKASGFGECKSQYLDDIAILTGGTVIRDEVVLSLDNAEKELPRSRSLLRQQSRTMRRRSSTKELQTFRWCCGHSGWSTNRNQT
ncbi:hypothetical protein SLA2020_386580 [Shorea laevis]